MSHVKFVKAASFKKWNQKRRPIGRLFHDYLKSPSATLYK